MNDITTYQQKSLFSDMYNTVWRWQYTTRKNIARSIRMIVMRKNDAPKLTR